jgi:hypothetical protein
MAETSTPPLLTTEAAAKLAEFARACKAAARAVSLYPGGAGTRVDLPLERNLWESGRDGTLPDRIVSPLDPGFGVDPLSFVPTQGG